MRDVNTYRSERRNKWRIANATAEVWTPWREYNERLPLGKWFVGSSKNLIVTMRSRKIGRSKYMPHESIKRGGTGPVFAS